MAESAARAGHVVTSLDAFGDLDQHPGVRALSLPRDLGVAFTATAATKAAMELECDAVAYLSPFENHPSAVRRLEQRAALWGNGPSVLKRARDPRVLAATFGSAVNAEPTRWLLKPRASGGGHRIRWWTPGDVVPAGSYVQPFFDGVPSSIIFVAAAGHAVPLGLTRQLVGEEAFGAREFRYCGNILCHAESADLLPATAALAEVAAREFNLVGVNCIDFIAREAHAYPIEINPRWSASMELVERAYGLTMFGTHAGACAAGELPSFDLSRARAIAPAVGKAIVFARHDVICGDTRDWRDDPTVRDVPHPGERIAAGRPACTVFADGANAAECHAALVRRANRVYEILESWSSVAA